MDKKSTYEVQQVFTNPRDGSLFTTVYANDIDTLAEAKKLAKELGKSRWVIVESRIVAQSAT